MAETPRDTSGISQKVGTTAVYGARCAARARAFRCSLYKRGFVAEIILWGEFNTRNPARHESRAGPVRRSADHRRIAALPLGNHRRGCREPHLIHGYHPHISEAQPHQGAGGHHDPGERME